MPGTEEACQDAGMDVYLTMPIDGMEFLKRLRGISRKEFSEIPLIVLTGDAQTDTVLEAFVHKVDGYISKPVSQKLL